MCVARRLAHAGEVFARRDDALACSTVGERAREIVAQIESTHGEEIARYTETLRPPLATGRLAASEHPPAILSVGAVLLFFLCFG